MSYMFKRVVGFDLETHLIQPGLLTPPIVCGAASVWTPETGLQKGRLLTKYEALDYVHELLLDDDALICGGNLPFDFGCIVAVEPELLRLIFEKYHKGLVHDLLVAQALDAIAKGHLFKEPTGLPLMSARGTQTDRYSLDICVRLVLGRTDAKVNDFWKLRYALLEPLPLELWPEEAAQYPVDDAENSTLVTVRQLGLDGYPSFENLQDLAAQCETDWALHLGAIWGLRSDESRVDLLEARAQELHEEYVKRFTEVGFFRKPREEYVEKGKRDPEAGKKDTAAVARAVAKAYGATGVCEICRGACRVQSIKMVPCNGVKVKNRLQGCQGDGCAVCAGKREIPKAGGTKICETCHGTGFGDLSSVPPTDRGGISTSRDTLSESGDETLAEFGENMQEKVLKTYLPYLRKGVDRPITLDYNVLVESGRASARGVIMLLPRGSMGVTVDGRWVPTLRECFTARPGRVFGSSDYPAGELCGLAQVCLWLFGHSRMAEIINESKDPGSLHTEFAARMVGVPVDVLKAKIKAGDKVAKAQRQASKAPNFGFGGGMGTAKFVLTNRKENVGKTDAPNGETYTGIRFCVVVGGARECGTVKVRAWGRPGYEREIPPTCKACLDLVDSYLKPLWFETFPEVREYHNWVKREIEASGNIVPCFGPWFPNRTRPHRFRDVSDAASPFCAAANNGFQALIADITKTAYRKVTRETYLDQDSVLYKSILRVPGFFHDELFSEGAEDTAHLWGLRIAELMTEAYREWIPDVQIKGVDTALQRYWSKDAEAVYDADGKLLVWEPKEKK